jgi:hypothetical protein
MSTHPSFPDPSSLDELVKNLALLPPHNPDRFETTDGYDNPNCTNGMRAGFTIDALAAFQKACNMSEEPDVAVADLICDLLHFVHSLDYSPQDVLENALTDFIAEAG